MQVHSAVGINLKRTFLKKDFKKMKFGHVATRIPLNSDKYQS